MTRTILLTAALCLTLSAPPQPVQARADELAQVKQENAGLRTELERVKAAYDRLEAETAQLRAEVAKLTMTKEDLEVQKRELTELAGLTASGDRVEAAEARFTTAYDEATGVTTVRTGPEKVKVTRGSGAEHILSLAYAYDGQQMRSPPTVIKMFIQANFAGGEYREQEIATFDIDGETVEVPIADYDYVSRRVRVAGKRSIRKDDETLTFDLDGELFRKLARAIQVKITVGTVELEPTRDQTALFRAIQKRIELGA